MQILSSIVLSPIALFFWYVGLLPIAFSGCIAEGPSRMSAFLNRSAVAFMNTNRFDDPAVVRKNVLATSLRHLESSSSKAASAPRDSSACRSLYSGSCTAQEISLRCSEFESPLFDRPLDLETAIVANQSGSLPVNTGLSGATSALASLANIATMAAEHHIRLPGCRIEGDIGHTHEGHASNERHVST